jgi:hypothetical protein
MKIRQQNLLFPHNVPEFVSYWLERPTMLVLGISLVTVLIMITMVGGLFFWAFELGSASMDGRTNQDQIEVARSGLQTMKKMVGNQWIWSESIRDEYNRIFMILPAQKQPAGYVYSDNYNGLNYSTERVY